MKYRGNSGFTIIELVVVIVILGILAAVALPRFMDATERAHDAAVMGTKGALAESVVLLRSQWFVNGNSKGDPENDVNDFGEGQVDVNDRGFAFGTSFTEGDAEWTTSATLGDDFCADVWVGLLGLQGPQVDPTAATAGTQYVAEAISATGTAFSGYRTCEYTYVPDEFNADVTVTDAPNRIIYYNQFNGQVTTNVALRNAEEAD